MYGLINVIMNQKHTEKMYVEFFIKDFFLKKIEYGLGDKILFNFIIEPKSKISIKIFHPINYKRR